MRRTLALCLTMLFPVGGQAQNDGSFGTLLATSGDWQVFVDSAYDICRAVTQSTDATADQTGPWFVLAYRTTSSPLPDLEYVAQVILDPVAPATLSAGDLSEALVVDGPYAWVYPPDRVAELLKQLAILPQATVLASVLGGNDVSQTFSLDGLAEAAIAAAAACDQVSVLTLQ